MMTLDEIAEELKCSKSQVFQALQSGMSKLRQNGLVIQMDGPIETLFSDEDFPEVEGLGE